MQPFSLASAVAARATAAAWPPIVTFARATVLQLLARIEHGKLTVQAPGGETSAFGDNSFDDTEANLFVKNDAFWLRLLIFADMGFAESYMLGDFESNNLTAFFKIFILNRAQLLNATTLTSSLSSTVATLARKTNTLSNSLLNVSAHYDISNEMFAAFLSDDMTYSCPIWANSSDPGSLEQTLEAAQTTKLFRFIDGAKIKKFDHVLEIGTGWGSFAIQAVRQTGCRVTSVTLSREQKRLAEKRIKAAGLQDSIEVLLCDYRALPVPERPYDKLVSIEMLEAVGKEYLTTYFECVDKLLKKDGGIAIFQCITMPECRYEGYSKGEDFIQRYIFPGGHLPTITQLVQSIERGTNGSLIIDKIENIGGHYAKALRLWSQKFEQNFQARIRPALLEEHPEMGEPEIELFRRKWRYYFAYCEAGFSTKTLGDVIITVTREGAIEALEGIPM